MCRCEEIMLWPMKFFDLMVSFIFILLVILSELTIKLNVS